ncbi:MAG TPA: hypothetical protein VGI75_13255 [Pirellulales bacterium]
MPGASREQAETVESSPITTVIPPGSELAGLTDKLGCTPRIFTPAKSSISGLSFMSNATTASDMLDREFLELRAGLLQVAAQLDRIDRAAGSAADDLRMRRIHQAIETLSKIGPNRAEQIQLIFSRPYEENWKEILLDKSR